MTRKKAESITLSVPVETARILYTILEYAPLVEKAIMNEKAASGVTFRKFTKKERDQLLALYDDLAFKLSTEMWS